MTLARTKRPYYLRVIPDPSPSPLLPPRKPRRPSAAVRKCLLAALDAAPVMREHVGDANARFPLRAAKATAALGAYACKLEALSAELKHALHCERQRDLWRKGKPYAP